MDRMKKGRLAKRAKSFKEDIVDILTNLRSPSSSPGIQQGSIKAKPLPISSQASVNGTNEPKKELLCIIEDLPAGVALNEHFTNEINKNILQVRYALKFYEDVVVKNTLELVPGSASVVLETVFSILTTLGNVFPAGEHSSSLISATNLVHQALSHLIRWSDDILLQSTTKDASSTQAPSQPAPADPAMLSEVRTVVDGLKIAVNDLVQIVIHKAANKLPPPSTLVCASPALYEAPVPAPLRLLTVEKDLLNGGFNGLMPPSSPKRASKSSDGSLLEDLPSTDWSSDSLPEEPDSHSPPPKPPLPLKGLLGDLVSDMSGLSTQDPLTPPPLPPKKRSLVGGLSPIAVQAPPFSPFSAFSPTGWGNPPTLPDLVLPSHPWMNETFDAVARDHSMALNGMFERQNVEQRWESSVQEERKNVSIVTSSSTNVFSSSSTTHSSSFQMQQQQHSSSFQLTSSMKASSSGAEGLSAALPPALPVKRRPRPGNRLPSQYDNLDQLDSCSSPGGSTLADFVAVRHEESSEAFHFTESKRVTSGGGMSVSSNSSLQLRREFSSQLVTASASSGALGEAPPLPPKKRHIKAYMEMVGPYSQPTEVELFRQTMEIYHAKAAQWQEQSEDLFQHNLITRASSYLTAQPPPVLPPKRNKSSTASKSPGGGTLSVTSSSSRRPSSELSLSPPITPTPRPAPLALMPAPNGDKATDATQPGEGEEDGMEELDLTSELVFKQPEDEGPEVRGGSVDALIIHATKLNKADYLYQTAFLATYRTFISPLELTRKLIHRFNYFFRKTDMGYQRAARHSFSLLVNVVDDLALSELEEKLMRQIIDFQSHLVGSGDLLLAKALRKKFLEKCMARRFRNAALIPPALASLGVTTRQSHLLDFKSGELAEQMTLLDAELFLRIEIPEVLVWAQEQNEEKSPNLTLFTEHFNKMSYWARSKILQSEAKDRERHVVKFIKIMKHLRRLNNFNSYLALLSALDSAPVRRLEWQKSITDGLQEYCALIDSSSSFRAYRQALAETQPPCIPYIGLILQDLTFVHIGNPDTLPDGRINFGKRWQQGHILDNMRRFQKCNYPFKRNDRIVAFFNEFNDFLCEEAMWQLSESIRPRGSNNNATKK